MPVYNGEKYLKESINSILNQTYKNFEFIIINDGSTDKSEEIINKFNDTRIVKLKNSTNIGIVETLNIGINKAKSKFIARMDCDDIANLKRFEIQLNFFKKNPEYGLCGTWAQNINSTGNIIENNKTLINHNDIKCALIFGNQFIHSSIMVKSEIIKKHKYDIRYKDAEDYKLWTNIVGESKCYNIPLYLIKYRIHNTSISYIENINQKILNKKISAELLQDFKIKFDEVTISIHVNLLNKNYQPGEIKIIYEWLSLLKLHLPKKYNSTSFQNICSNILLNKIIYKKSLKSIFKYKIFINVNYFIYKFINLLRYKLIDFGNIIFTYMTNFSK